jgi:S-DNA-T family DNA segregation ATPase FtsK/SpoIIIE
MAKKQTRRKKQAFRIKMKSETKYSILAVILIFFALLVLISFTGQGQWLSWLNAFLRQKIGIATLFLPFVFLSAGLVMMRSKFAWSNPAVLLGTLLLMFGVTGFAGSGEIGANLLANLGNLITHTGALLFFATASVAGLLILSQSSLIEFVTALFKLFSKKAKPELAKDDLFKNQITEKEMKKAHGFSIQIGRASCRERV